MTLIRSRRRARPRWLLALGGSATAVLLGAVVVLAASLGTLTTTDGNLKVDGAETDWASASVDEDRKNDLPAGSGDNSFTQGTKEDTALPVTEAGSIPPNKSDLKTFGVYSEKVGGVNFVHLFWTRVQDPSGTTNMDFELNQKACDAAVGAPDDPDCAPNDVTPIRTAG